MAIERAYKTAYFSDKDGINIVDFQLAPIAIDGEVKASYDIKTLTGRTKPDSLWIKNEKEPFIIDIFIDRTQESIPNPEQFNPGGEKGYLSDFLFKSLGQYTRNIKAMSENVNSASSDAVTAKAKKSWSSFAVNPNFKQDPNIIGVYADLDKILYFTKPELYTGQSRMTGYNTDVRGEISIYSDEQTTFSPPPAMYYFYGNLWRECVLLSVKYRLSAMTKYLIPCRLEATLTLNIQDEGILSELSGDYQQPNNIVKISQDNLV